jgi:hypothetical protein
VTGPQAVVVRGGHSEPFDVGPLLSQYLALGYTTEGLTLTSLKFLADRHQVTSTWDVARPQPSAEHFHLAGLSAFIMSQQVAVVLAMLEMGLAEKHDEVWMEQADFHFLAPITRTQGLTCLVQLGTHEVQSPREAKGRWLERHVFEVRVRIETAYRSNARIFVDRPAQAPSHDATGAV